MPTGPKGQKHPTDVIGNAVKVNLHCDREADGMIDGGKDPQQRRLARRMVKGAPKA
ncbi:RNA-binding protein [Rhizobium leguminosarum]|uniref:RNA-binding protein n=1 Tax=Rhizobium leguminosarum TaxID=384 RepID=UPI0021BC26C9|nr:RNA-binding protein [Rhizobium leguminosarum]